jgi:hypothetical protein
MADPRFPGGIANAVSGNSSGVVLNSTALLLDGLENYLKLLEAGAPSPLPDFALAAAAAIPCPTPGGAQPKPVEVKVWLNTLDARLDALALEGGSRAERKALLVRLAALHSRLVRLPAPDPPDASPTAPPPAPPRRRAPNAPSPAPAPLGFKGVGLVLALLAAAAAALWVRAAS